MIRSTKLPLRSQGARVQPRNQIFAKQHGMREINNRHFEDWSRYRILKHQENEMRPNNGEQKSRMCKVLEKVRGEGFVGRDEGAAKRPCPSPLLPLAKKWICFS